MSGFPASDTLGLMVDEVVDTLQGHTLEGERITTLDGAITSNATSLMVLDDSVLSRGTIEIDQELIWIATATGTVATVQPWGRGFKGTLAEAHADGAAVYINPAWPRSVVAREIRNATRALYPMLFAVKEHLLTNNSVRYQYDLPADCEQVLRIDWRRTELEGWIPADAWDFITIAPTTDLPNGKLLSIMDLVPVGVDIKVTYLAKPTVMSALTDTWASTGLSDSAKDVVLYGVLARLARSLDLARLSTQSAQAAALGQARPQGIAVQVAREYQQNYQTRLAEERRRLMAQYPTRAYKTR
jgi:hypothetical protein